MRQPRVVRDFGLTHSVTVKAAEIVQVLSNLICSSFDAVSNNGIIALRVSSHLDLLCILIEDISSETIYGLDAT
jgi:hypothetical protein